MTDSGGYQLVHNAQHARWESPTNAAPDAYQYFLAHTSDLIDASTRRKRGGWARAQKLSAARRSEIARMGAAARWHRV